MSGREADIDSARLEVLGRVEAALDRNIEIGLVLRDRALAASVFSHFRGLIDRNLLHPLPMA